MSGLTICFIFIIFKAVVADLEIENPEILLNCTYKTERKYTVDKSKPLKLLIQNCNAKYVRCYNHYFLKGVDEKAFIDTPNTNDIVNIINITDAMSTMWVCDVLKEYRGGLRYVYNQQNYTVTHFRFVVHVKGAKSVNVSVNSMNLQTADLSVPGYDGESIYLFEDGETIDYVCNATTIYSHNHTIKLKYYDGKGTLLFESIEAVLPYNFRSLFSSRNDNAYIICTLTSREPREGYHYKTTFILRDPDSDADIDQRAIEISVNGLKLVPLPSVNSEDKNVDFYRYKFIEGDVLNITCKKRHLIGGNVRLLYSPKNSDFPKGELKPDDVIVVSLDTSYLVLHKKALLCVINNSDVQKTIAKILFLSDLPKNALRVRGLSPRNVEYQYNNGRNWIIGYQYRANESLDLTCVYKYEVLVNNNSLRWTFDRKVINTYLHNNTEVSCPDRRCQTSTANLVLLENHNQSRIVCQSFNLSKTVGQVEVVLHLISESSVITVSDERTDLYIILAASLGVMMVIISTVCLVCWCSKTKKVRLIENAYENIYENESPIPEFPSQWENYYHDDHYSQIDENAIPDNTAYENIRKLYATPNIRQSKTPSENVYTEIDEHHQRNAASNSKNDAQVLSQECRNNLYKSTTDPPYDVLRRSNLISCNDDGKYTAGYDKSSQSKPKCVTFGHDGNKKPASSIYSNNIVARHTVNPFAEVKPASSNNSPGNSNNMVNKYTGNHFNEVKNDVNAQINDVIKKKNNKATVEKGSRTESSFVPVNQNTNSDYVGPYSEFSEVDCVNTFYEN